VLNHESEEMDLVVEEEKAEYPTDDQMDETDEMDDP
jgi:hypothetical protein